MKTVSKGVLVLTAAAIGGDLIFEAEPLDTTVYNKVSEQNLTVTLGGYCLLF